MPFVRFVANSIMQDTRVVSTMAASAKSPVQKSAVMEIKERFQTLAALLTFQQIFETHPHREDLRRRRELWQPPAHATFSCVENYRKSGQVSVKSIIAGFVWIERELHRDLGSAPPKPPILEVLNHNQHSASCLPTLATSQTSKLFTSRACHGMGRSQCLLYHIKNS